MRSRSSARDQGGFTLVEMIIAVGVSLLLVGGAVAVFTSALKSEPRASKRSAQVEQGRVMLERITRELRQGSEVVEASPSHLALMTYVRSTCAGEAAVTAALCRVDYSCSSGGVCTRTLGESDLSATGSPTTVIAGLADGNVFTYTPNADAPAYISISLVFPYQEGVEAVTLEDGVALRNVDSTPES